MFYIVSNVAAVGNVIIVSKFSIETNFIVLRMKKRKNNVTGNPKIMLNFILREISEYYPITFLVLFVPVDTENQAVQQFLQFIMYIFKIMFNMI